MKNIQYLILSSMILLLSACEKDTLPTNFAPNIITGEITDSFRTGATIHGEIKSSANYSNLEYGILISELQTMAEYTKFTANSGETQFSVQAKNLKPGTAYYYCAYVYSGYSMIMGDIKNFTTTGSTAPVFGEITVVSDESRSAQVQVALLDDGGSDITSSMVCWNETGKGDPTINDNVINATIEKAVLKATLSGLKSGKEYQVRAYATNATDNSYSKMKTFHTKAATIPLLSDVTLVSSRETSITVKSKVEEKGASEVTEYGFCWSKDKSEPTKEDNSLTVDSQNENGEFELTIDNLSLNTTYYVRAYAVNKDGTGYSNVYSITTRGAEPGIYSLEDLIAFRDAKNSGGDLSKWKDWMGFINIHANIDLGDMDWEPINEISSGESLTCVNGSVIKYKKTTTSFVEDNSWAFIRVNNGSIYSLNIEASLNIDNTNEEPINMSAMCAVNNGDMSDCIVTLTDGSTIKNIRFGGIAYQNNTYLWNCTSKGKLTTTTDVGGICCVHKGTITAENKMSITLSNASTDNILVGGIAATVGTERTRFDSYCKNQAEIRIEDEDSSVKAVGGIVAYASGKIYFFDCENYGTIIGSNTTQAIGGIIGNGSELDDNVTLRCSNMGAITGNPEATGNIAGILGNNQVLGECTFGGTVNGVAGTENNAVGKEHRLKVGICSLKDLQDFRDAKNSGGDLSKWKNEHDEIHLYVDLDMGDLDWEPIDEISAGETFHGHSHTIKYKKSSLNYIKDNSWGFIRKNRGTIRELDFEVNFQVNNTDEEALNMATVCVINEELISGCNVVLTNKNTLSNVRFGGVAYQNNDLITRCNIKGNLETTADVGGICCESNYYIFHSNNEMTITLKDASYPDVLVGGVVALVSVPSSSSVVASFRSCENLGNILIDEKTHPVKGIGGIAACIQGQGWFIHCINRGNITASETTSAVGGIAGDALGMSLKVNMCRFQDCTNIGKIKGNADVTGCMVGILGGTTKTFDSECVFEGSVNGVAGSEENAVGKYLE